MELPTPSSEAASTSGSPMYYSPEESLQEGHATTNTSAEAAAAAAEAASSSSPPLSATAPAPAPAPAPVAPPTEAATKMPSASDAATTPAAPQASASASTPPSSPPRRPSVRNRARTNSTKLLQRFTSRGSVIEGSNAGSQPPGSPTSEKSGRESIGKIDRAALSKARGKYKSGINWESSNLGNPNGEIEPFMETADVGGSPRDEKQLLQAMEDSSMLATGGTAAAKAYYNSLNMSVNGAIFSAQQRAASEAQLRAANEYAAQQRILPPGMGPAPTFEQRPLRVNAASTSNTNRHSSSDRLPSINTAVQAMQGSQPPTATSTESMLTSRPQMQPTKPQRNLSPNMALPPSAWKGPESAGPRASTTSDSQTSTNESARTSPDQEAASISGGKSPAPSIRSKRRTFLGLGSKSTDKVDKVGRKSRRSSTTSYSEAVGDGSMSADGTVRRRRFQDTRELDLLAAELAREAAIEALGPPQPGFAGWSQTPSVSGSRTPAERRVSGQGSALGMQGISPMTSPSSGSLANGTVGGPLQPFTPPFAREGRGTSPASSTPGSPRSFSEALPGAYANRSGTLVPGKGGAAGSLSTTQKAQVSGLPTEMLTGLGDGPYPMGPGSVDGDGMSSGYNTPRRSRVGSVGTGSIGAGKKSVLSMTMHDPEAELQGLTKPPKSGKNTPFGSRAPSRNVTPRSSVTKLNEAFKNQQAPAMPARRSQSEDGPHNMSIASAASTQLSVPTPVQETPPGRETPDVTTAAATTPATATASRIPSRGPSPTSMPQQQQQPARGPSPQPQPAALAPSAAAPAAAQLSSKASTSHLETNSRPSTTTSKSGGSSLSVSSKNKARRSFLSVFGRGKDNDIPAASQQAAKSSDNKLAPPLTTASAASLSSGGPSQRSSTILTPTTSGQESSVTRLTPSSEVSQSNGYAVGAAANGKAALPVRAPSPQPPVPSQQLAPQVEGDEMTVRRSRSPSRPERSTERAPSGLVAAPAVAAVASQPPRQQVAPPQAQQPARAQQQHQQQVPPQPQPQPQAQAQPRVPSQQQAKPSTPIAPSLSSSASSTTTKSQKTTNTAAAPKRPGNLKRLLSRFGSSGKVPRASSASKGAASPPPMPSPHQGGAAPALPSATSSTASAYANAQPQGQQPSQQQPQLRARINAGPQSAAAAAKRGNRGGMVFANGTGAGNGNANGAMPNGVAVPYSNQQQQRAMNSSSGGGHQTGDLSTGSAMSGQETYDFKMVSPHNNAATPVSVGR